MPQFFKTIVKFLAYTAAALVILLAIAVGLFRLLLPRVPEYQDEIKQWANTAVGMQVEFAGMNARWRLSGPELTFQDAVLTANDADQSLLTAGEVSVSVSLLRLLRDRQLVVDRIYIRDSELAAQRSMEDGWLVQDTPLSQIIGSREVSADQAGAVLVIVEDVDVEYLLPDSSASVALRLRRLEVERNEAELRIDAEIDLPASLGERLTLAATQELLLRDEGVWQLFVEGKALQVTGLAELEPSLVPQFRSGQIDLATSLQVSPLGVDLATTSFVLSDLSGAIETTLAPFGARGRIEFSQDSSGWLVAATDFSLTTVDGDWPESAIGVQMSRADDDALHSVSVTASYLKLDDLRYVSEWLPEKERARLAELAPSGVLRDVRVDLNEIQSDEPRFDISALLEEAGIAAAGSSPGVRQLSGLVRTDNAGGRVEISSSNLQLDLASQLAEPIIFDDAIGTVIWRRNLQGTTVLSDSIRLRNADMDSQSSLQIFVPAEGGSPEVDVQGTWSVNDVAAVKRYLPAKLIKPKLYQWLSSALVAGNAPTGTMQLTGKLDDFPFDNGEGVFRIEGHLENTILRYSDKWPDVQNMTLDVIVDGMRLYSHKNSAINAGNSVIDAKIEIPDLRKPVLYIDAFATGSLESIRDFSRGSPIANVFGGHLDRVTVSGDASFSLKLEYPILDYLNYDFTTRIQTSGGILSLDGFAPALSELNGIVNVSRDGVQSESLFGRFLGEQVNIELSSPVSDDSPYSVVAEISGLLTDAGLKQELAPQLETVLYGSSQYQATMRFPRAGQAESNPFQIDVESNLDGMEIRLPKPFGKEPAGPQALKFNITFPQPGRISSVGGLAENTDWTLGFISRDGVGWDFDRGTVALGDGLASMPETRGLHVVGAIDRLVLNDWLALAGGGAGRAGTSERIRSIDLSIGSLNVIGQDLKDHHVIVHRSADDWLISIEGEFATGSVSVPYDFTTGRPLVVDMDRLILPGADDTQADTVEQGPLTNPRRVPPIKVIAQQFGLGERMLGELEAEFDSTPRGLESTVLTTSDDTFTLQGSAGWIIDASSPLGQRTFLNTKLVSTDIRQTMERLNYQPGIAGEDLEIDLDIYWDGGPGEDFMARLNGEVQIRLGAGQLDDVEPGAGRVFGLMSIVALPRRMSLDFSDVFDKGYGFDSIIGSFRINNGDAYTCNLSLEGPAADVGIVGRTGLASRDYDQTAVVSANVGNTLPVVGAFIAGPQVAAALLIFSQIFKKPLQEVGQIYYGISGSWDAPEIASTNAAGFATTSQAAECIDE